MLISTACNQSSSIGFDDPIEHGLYSIAYLKAMCDQEQTTIRQNVIIEGIVTANDRFGEWHHRIVVEDQSGGIQIALIATDLHRRYPIGTTLYIHCNGLTLRNVGGRIELGDTQDPYQRFGITEALFDRYLQPRQGIITEPTPRTITLDELTATLTDRYVCICDVSFPEAASHLAWCAVPATEEAAYYRTEHPIVDKEGKTGIVSILGTATYADEPLPDGKGSLYGIVDCFNNRTVLRIVNYGIDFVDTILAEPTKACPSVAEY